MTAAAFLEANPTYSVLHRFLEHALRHMVPAFDAGAGIEGACRCGNDVLPCPGGGRVGILAGERIRQVHRAVSGGKVFLMHQLHPGQMPLEWGGQGLGQHGDPIVPPFAVAPGDLVRGTIHLLDSEPHARHQAQPGAREHTRHEGGPVAELGEYRVRFLTGAGRGEPLRAFGACNLVQVWKWLFEDVPVQQQAGMQGAALRGRGDLLVECQVGEKGAALGGPAFGRGVVLLLNLEGTILLASAFTPKGLVPPPAGLFAKCRWFWRQQWGVPLAFNQPLFYVGVLCLLVASVLGILAP